MAKEAKNRRIPPNEILALRLAARGWTQRRLSIEISADEASVSRWVRGDYDPSLQAALRMAEKKIMAVEEWKKP